MKKVFTVLIAVLTVIFASEALANPINSDGTFRGIKLWGKVRVVDAFGDIKVQVVDSFADLRVQKVDASSGRITAKVVIKKNFLIHLILDKNNRKFEKS